MDTKKEEKNQIPSEILSHLRGLIRDTGLPDTGETLDRFAAIWLEKQRLFEAQTSLLELQNSPSLEREDTRGMLLLTRSGSLISLYAAREDVEEGSAGAEKGAAEGAQESAAEGLSSAVRDFEYAGISLRTDVPELIRGQGVSLLNSPETGAPLEMSGTQIKKTSPIYRIAVCPKGLKPDEQDTRIREATIFITNGFLKINKSLTNPEGTGIDHFTKQNIVAYMADRNDLSRKAVRQILDDYHSMLESAMMMGEKVNLGRIGRLSIGTRPPQKARIGRNPATGEEIVIPAKPARGVPKISFSTHIKERAEPLAEE